MRSRPESFGGFRFKPTSIPAHMQTDDMAPLRRHPEWLATLRAYWETHLQIKQDVADFDGWLPRLTSIPEVPPESLSAIHGRLIAFGYLKFELSPKDTLLRYQLTPLGRTAVTGEAQVEPAECSQDHDLALSA